MIRVWLYNKLIYIVFPCFPQGENIVNASFPLEGFSLAFTDNSEGVICRLQVAGCRLQVVSQNLEKELNVLNGLQIFPST